MGKRRESLSSYKVVDTPPSAVPRSVAAARAIQFGFDVTAYLSFVEYGPGELSLIGLVFGDRGRRFDDGDRIRTSIIMRSEEIQGYLVVQTLSSLYVVCDWAGYSARGASKARH